MVIGLLGMGNIGSGVYEHLSRTPDMKVKRILELRRHPGFEHLETSDYSEILNDPEIETVVELMGGVEPARTFTLQALKAGKNVVSANKLMLSSCLEEILTCAKENGVQYRYDASVGGSIPFLYNLMRHSTADTLTAISGIVNGTTNLILDTMQSSPRTFDDVLAEAQRLGYAEANPSADIDGIDARCKIGIASAVAYGKYVRPEEIPTEGIRHITDTDIAVFKANGWVCRLIAASRRNDNGTVSISVEPTLFGPDALEAAVHTNNNTISVTGNYFGVQHFYGQGAGKDPTAFAVELGIRDIVNGTAEKFNPIPDGYATVDNTAVTRAYYLRTTAKVDVPHKDLGGNSMLLEPLSIAAMHALAAELAKEDENLFFAALA